MTLAGGSSGGQIPVQTELMEATNASPAGPKQDIIKMLSPDKQDSVKASAEPPSKKELLKQDKMPRDDDQQPNKDLQKADANGAVLEKNGPRLVDKILNVIKITATSLPPHEWVNVLGEVRHGYTKKAMVLRAAYKKPPEDGIQDYFFLAVPPEGNAAHFSHLNSGYYPGRSKGDRIHGAAGAYGIAGAYGENGPRIVVKILKVECLRKKESGLPVLCVHAIGQVPTGGYTKVRLLRAAYDQAPENGIQDYFLLAVPPEKNAAQVVSEVSASEEWSKYTKEAPWLKGIRVHCAEGGVVVKMLGDK